MFVKNKYFVSNLLFQTLINIMVKNQCQSSSELLVVKYIFLSNIAETNIKNMSQKSNIFSHTEFGYREHHVENARINQLKFLFFLKISILTINDRLLRKNLLEKKIRFFSEISIFGQNYDQFSTKLRFLNKIINSPFF